MQDKKENKEMKPIVFYDFKPDKDDPNNKIVIKKSDLEELLDKTYEAGYQDGQKEPRQTSVWMTTKRDFGTVPKVLSKNIEI